MEGKGRDWKGRRTDNSVDCTRVAFGSRKLGAKREEGGEIRRVVGQYHAL